MRSSAIKERKAREEALHEILRCKEDLPLTWVYAEKPQGPWVDLLDRLRTWRLRTAVIAAVKVFAGFSLEKMIAHMTYAEVYAAWNKIGEALGYTKWATRSELEADGWIEEDEE